MSDPLRSAVIKLAHANPELRPHLLPLLKEASVDKTAMEFATKGALDAYLKAHPEADKSKHKVKPGAQGVTTDTQGHYVKKLTHPTSGKHVKDVTVGDDQYTYNPAYKTYNRKSDNELLTSKDVSKIKWGD